MKEHVINKFLSVRLEGDTWSIYIANKKVQKHKYIVSSISPWRILESEEPVSADLNSLNNELIDADFESVCEILEIWYEYGYDTWLIIKEGAFPLLRLLYIAGDPLANKVFKREIAKRLESGLPETIAFLVDNEYIDYLDEKTIVQLEQVKYVGSQIKKARCVKEFLFHFDVLSQSDDLWKDFTEQFISPIEIEREFAKLMKLDPSDEGAFIPPFLFMLSSDDKIEELHNLSNSEILDILRKIITEIVQKQSDDSLVKKEFVINRYLTVKLIEDKTYIYANNRQFIQCKYLLMNIDTNNFEAYDQFHSIDEVAPHLDSSLEGSFNMDSKIPPETEFWGHCSNLQVWVEEQYNTNLLHSNISFPLLKKLTELGDPIARKVFKEEIVARFINGFPSVVEYLTRLNYLNFLNNEEIETLLYSTSDIFIKSQIALHYAINHNFIKALEIFYKLKHTEKVRLKDLKPFAEMWEELANYYLEVGDRFNRIRAKKHVVKLDPDFRLGWENLGHAYRHAKKDNKAITAYKEAIKRNPENNSTYSSLGTTLFELGRLQEAKGYAIQALRIDPRDNVAKEVLEKIKNL